MNLFEKLFGKKGSSSQEIGFDELTEWLEGRQKRIADDLGKKSGTLLSGIDDAQKEIKESVTLLEKAEPEGRYHLKLVKIALSNRDNMVKQVRMLLENITIPEDTGDAKAIIAFHESTIQTLNVCLENMTKSYQYTKLVFAEESKNVIADVNSLGRSLNELIEPINDQKHILDAIDKARDMVSDIRNIGLDLGSMEKSISETEKRSVSLKKEIGDKEEALNLLHESDAWKQYNGSIEKINSLEAEADKRLSEINSMISPLNKALNRLKQLSDSGRYTLKPENRETLNLCLTCPVDVPGDFFIEFRKIVESGVLNLPKTDKLLSQIELASSSLGDLRKEYYAILQDIEKKKEEISKMEIIGKEKETRDMLSDLKDKLAAAEKELDSLKKQPLKQELESKRLRLQQYVSIIDSKVRIT